MDKQVTKNFNCIDLLKFICAYLICIIHIRPFPNEFLGVGNYLNFGLMHYLARIAVPFYFVSAGFFLFRKMELYDLKTNVITNYCFKIIRFMGIWCMLLVLGGKEHLWYLTATVVGVIMLSFLFKSKLKLRYIFLIAGILYIIGLLGDTYSSVGNIFNNINIVSYVSKAYSKIFKTTRNGIFMGFLFISLGALFAHKNIKINIKMAVCGFILSMLLLLCEAFYVRSNLVSKDYNMYIFLVPGVFFMFYLALNINLKDRPIYKKLRGIGILVFYMHPMFKKFFDEGLTFLKNTTNIDLSSYLFIMAVLSVTAFSIIIEHLSHKEKFKWLKYLYS